MSDWATIEPLTRERAYRTIDHDPRVLFEQDGGPVGVEAEVYMARLFGLDDEIVRDGMRLREAMPLIVLPISQRISLATYAEDAAPQPLTLRTAEYVLQSSYALVHLDAMYAPDELDWRGWDSFRVLYLRYKRRL